jgi:hypothetical protein
MQKSIIPSGLSRGILVEDRHKKSGIAAFFVSMQSPRKCRQAIILNLEVQGGHLPDASGASAWDAHNSITMVRNQFSKSWFKEYRPKTNTAGNNFCPSSLLQDVAG